MKPTTFVTIAAAVALAAIATAARAQSPGTPTDPAASATEQVGIAPTPGHLIDGDTVNVPDDAAIVRVPEDPAWLHVRDLSGPRVGFTFAVPGTHNADNMIAHGINPVVSQFGWQFEHNIAPIGGGPTLVTEVVPLLGGFEYGKLIPTLNAALGLRRSDGWEFGVGPSLTLSNASGQVSQGLLFAVGRSLRYDGVSLPVNAVMSVNKGGVMFSVLAGYAIRHQR